MIESLVANDLTLLFFSANLFALETVLKWPEYLQDMVAFKTNYSQLQKHHLVMEDQTSIHVLTITTAQISLPFHGVLFVIILLPSKESFHENIIRLQGSIFTLSVHSVII